MMTVTFYIEMAPGMKTRDAPALLIAAGAGSQMVNYRVGGSCYVVDRLFNQAVLVSGVGRQQDRVTIAYAGDAGWMERKEPQAEAKARPAKW